MKSFAVLQLSGCAGCEVSLLNADEWVGEYRLVYMPLVISAHDVPEVDVLLVSGGVRTDEDLYNLRRAAPRAGQVVAVGTCAISGGVAILGDRDEVRAAFSGRAGSATTCPGCCPSATPSTPSCPWIATCPAARRRRSCSWPLLYRPARFQAERDRLPGVRPEKAQRHAPDQLCRLSAGRGGARHLPDQPGLSVHRLLDARRLPRALHARRAIRAWAAAGRPMP